MTKTTTQNGQLECCGRTWKSSASMAAHQRWHGRAKRGVVPVDDVALPLPLPRRSRTLWMPSGWAGIVAHL